MRKMIKLFIGFLLFLGFSCNPTIKNRQTFSPVPIIFDTDMGPDYDDVAALTVLHALADKNEAKILATISSNLDSLVVPCIDVINTYFGRSEIPIGTTTSGVKQGDYWHKEKWTEALVAKYPHRIKSTKDVPCSVEVYRKILASEPDTSVVIITVGFLTNLANLLESKPDEYSQLNGRELVTKKVKRLVAMAGHFPYGKEFNVCSDSDASSKVFAEWETPIILSGFEIGEKILTGKRLIKSNISETPAKTVYSICMKQGDFDGRSSWDQTTVLVGVRGTEKYFNTIKGCINIYPDGSNTWNNDSNGRHEYLIWKMPVEELTYEIENLMMHENK